MTLDDAAKLLDLIADRAPVLAQRGVRRVELGGVAFTLVGPEPAAAPAAPAADDEPVLDALHDPSTYGRPAAAPGQRMPKRVRTPLMEPDQ